MPIILNEQYLQDFIFLMAPVQNTTAPVEQEQSVRYRPTTALGFKPLQLPQILAGAIAAAPAAGTAQQQLQQAPTVYQGTNLAPRPQILSRSASAMTLGVTLIKSRLNREPVGGETPMYFHHGLNEWRKFLSEEMSEEMVEKDDVLEFGAKGDSTRPRKRNILKKVFSLKPRGGKSGGEMKGVIISAPVAGSVQYNKL